MSPEEKCATHRKIRLVQNESDSEITEDSNSSFGGWNVTDTNHFRFNLNNRNLSDSTVEDITPSSSVDETPPVNADSSVRKSKRTNAGKHSNPFNLPKSVAVKKADVRGNLDQVKFEQLPSCYRFSCYYRFSDIAINSVNPPFI
jgi:hypothetical protein